MNRCTQLDDILHKHVPRLPHEPCWISRWHQRSRSFFVSGLKFIKMFSSNVEKS